MWFGAWTHGDMGLVNGLAEHETIDETVNLRRAKCHKWKYQNDYRTATATTNAQQKTF